ncbi:MAG TPA: DinB family protein [Streptosporangiaceae bacterium]|nr:DinB family protein [Streptosporangiaceae bacterium]
MPGPDAKADLHRCLQAARDALLWKLDDLSEYDVRRPLTPTGTNLLGLVKHLAGVELWYFGDAFGRPPEDRPWSPDDARQNADFWATAEESRDRVVGMYRRAWAHADETIRALDLDAPGQVPWWPADRTEVTLHQILVHVVAETHRHAGQADIVRELIDGTAGLQPDDDNLRTRDRAWWADYRDRVERVAREAGQRQQGPERGRS